jgi:hypothetical protein
MNINFVQAVCGRQQVAAALRGEHPSEAEARVHFEAFAARLKPCPFKAAVSANLGLRLKSCPFKTAVFENLAVGCEGSREESRLGSFMTYL